MIAQSDRIAFSLYEVQAPAQIKGIQAAQSALSAQITKAQSLDTANMNLFDPSNILVSKYHNEYQYVDGTVRTSITEQNIIDSANKKLGNYFFPNNTSISVPSLSDLGNIWPYVYPFALTYAIGKDYTETNSTITAELTNGLTMGYIPLIESYTPFTPPSGPGTPISTVMATATSYKTLLNLEASALLAIVDTDPTNAANNTAAYNNIETVIIPALNTYLASTGSSSDLNALQAAVSTRLSFISGTRIPQLNSILGSITQDLVTNGAVTASSGLYGKRYSFLALRLNALNGSLAILASLKAASGAQSSIIANIISTDATYYSILPTSAFLAPSTNTNIVQIADVSFLSPGNSIFVMADNQAELQLGVVSVSGNVVTLSGIVPTKYTANVRLYKDLS